jgi:sugar phosphate isomerase/epimerase
MKIGVDNYCYHRYFGEIYAGQKNPGIKWTLHDFLNHIDVKHKELEAVSFESCFITHEEKKELPSLLKNVDYEVVFAWGHPNGFMDRNISDVLSEIKEYLELSNQLGQDKIRIAASSIAYYNKPHIPQVDLAIKTIKKIITLSEEYGVKLALENHGDFYLIEMLKILETVNSDYLGVTFDTGNSLRFHEDCVSALRTYSKKVLLIHAKDVAPEKGVPLHDPTRLNCTPAGKGIVDFKGIFNELRANKFNGMVLIEISRLHSDYEHINETEVINTGIKYLKGLRRHIS